MASEGVASIRLRGPAGPMDLRLERSRVVRVDGDGRAVESLPLDLVGSVSYGAVPRNMLWAALGLFGFVVVSAALWYLLPLWYVYFYGGAALGGLLLVAGILATVASGGRRVRIRSDAVDWKARYAKAQAQEVADFLEDLMTVRLAFLEGTYEPKEPSGQASTWGREDE